MKTKAREFEIKIDKDVKIVDDHMDQEFTTSPKI